MDRENTDRFLCATCEAIFSKTTTKRLEDWLRRGRRGKELYRLRFPHHKTLAALQQAAASCQLCAALSFHRAFADRTILNRDEDSVLSSRHGTGNLQGLCYSIKKHRGNWLLDFYATMARDDGGDTEESCHFTLLPATRGFVDHTNIVDPLNADTISYLGSPTHRCSSTGDPQVTELAAWWYRRCMTSHKSCIKSQRTGFRPKRLLEIRSESIILVESKGVIPEEYAALSHCWGQELFLTLNLANLPDMLAGIDVHKLPRNFQNAVIVARRLGIKYLWIDSLCILQSGDGSTEDWQEHSYKMSSIYSAASIVIAATCANKADDGFLRPRNPKTVQPLQVLFRRPEKPDAAKAQAAPYIVLDRLRFWDRSLYAQPIFRRA